MAEGQSKSNLQGALLALAAMGIYATHDVFIKFLGGHYAPFQTLFFAVLFSFPLVTIVILHDTTVANLRPTHPWWVLIRTISSTIVGFCAFYAFSNLPLAETYSILFITPLLITVLSIPLLGETVRLRRWAAVVVGLAGVMIVLQPGHSHLGLGHLAALGAAMFSSLSNVIVRKIGQDERSAVLMLYPMVSNFLVMGALLAFVYKPMPVEHIGSFAAMAVLGTCAGLLFIAAYKRAEATVVAPMQYSQILWASFYGYVFFGETLKPNVLIGAAVIIGSGLYILFREGRGRASEHTPVLSSMDLARDKGTRPSANIWARLRSGGK
ncbi:DMT family transporter [Frigidibacter sp. ROC022]|uniref:DMT family transporter n=1 Tax=Frigidibacter sp. ROC022 TaxID=2971796 RepID=UPI00215A1F38|nr:DMT family transporter [Frigidibacter sp. ROC022]MCR8724832.1 DMT family transporter [Frigidibacter sp. ROC022]